MTIVLCVLGALGLVVVTAIATAVLVLTLSSSSSFSSTPNMSMCQCQQEIQDLRHEMISKIAANSRRITYHYNMTATFMERIANNSEKVTNNGENIAINRERIATFGNKTTAFGERITSINTSLAHIRSFGGCNTSIETMCTVMPAAGVCVTTFIQYQRPEETVLDFICLRIQETQELIATAELVNNELGCTCHVLDSFGSQTHDVLCGLQVTRCRVIN